MVNTCSVLLWLPFKLIMAQFYLKNIILGYFLFWKWTYYSIVVFQLWFCDLIWWMIWFITWWYLAAVVPSGLLPRILDLAFTNFIFFFLITASYLPAGLKDRFITNDITYLTTTDTEMTHLFIFITFAVLF